MCNICYYVQCCVVSLSYSNLLHRCHLVIYFERCNSAPYAGKRVDERLSKTALRQFGAVKYPWVFLSCNVRALNRNHLRIHHNTQQFATSPQLLLSPVQSKFPAATVRARSRPLRLAAIQQVYFSLEFVTFWRQIQTKYHNARQFPLPKPSALC